MAPADQAFGQGTEDGKVVSSHFSHPNGALLWEPRKSKLNCMLLCLKPFTDPPVLSRSSPNLLMCSLKFSNPIMPSLQPEFPVLPLTWCGFPNTSCSPETSVLLHELLPQVAVDLPYPAHPYLEEANDRGQRRVLSESFSDVPWQPEESPDPMLWSLTPSLVAHFLNPVLSKAPVALLTLLCEGQSFLGVSPGLCNRRSMPAYTSEVRVHVPLNGLPHAAWSKDHPRPSHPAGTAGDLGHSQKAHSLARAAPGVDWPTEAS